MQILFVQTIGRDVVKVLVEDSLPFVALAKKKNGRISVAAQSFEPIDLAILKRRLGSPESMDYDYSVDLYYFIIE